MMASVTNRIGRALQAPAVVRQRSRTMDGHGVWRINRIATYGWVLAALGTLLVVAPELAWMLLVVAAVFLGTRESRSVVLGSEG
jgi:hypothetical protein